MGLLVSKKDANSMTTLYLSDFKKYFVKLNGFEFGEEEGDNKVE